MHCLRFDLVPMLHPDKGPYSDAVIVKSGQVRHPLQLHRMILLHYSESQNPHVLNFRLILQPSLLLSKMPIASSESGVPICLNACATIQRTSSLSL